MSSEGLDTLNCHDALVGVGFAARLLNVIRFVLMETNVEKAEAFWKSFISFQLFNCELEYAIVAICPLILSFFNRFKI